MAIGTKRWKSGVPFVKRILSIMCMVEVLGAQASAQSRNCGEVLTPQILITNNLNQVEASASSWSKHSFEHIKDVYHKTKTDAGGNVVVEGIPLGANLSDEDLLKTYERVTSYSASGRSEPLCANERETPDPLLITVEGEEVTTRDDDHGEGDPGCRDLRGTEAERRRA